MAAAPRQPDDSDAPCRTWPRPVPPTKASASRWRRRPASRPDASMF